MTETKKRYFPCPVCKGRGDFGDGDFVDVGVGVDVQVSAHTPCYYCDAKGMIEIGGTVQKRNRIYKIGLTKLKPGKDYSSEEIMELGKEV